jgi:hypothetical protein
MDRIGFPAKWDERYDFVVVSDARGCTRMGVEDGIARVVYVEP